MSRAPKKVPEGRRQSWGKNLCNRVKEAEGQNETGVDKKRAGTQESPKKGGSQAGPKI